MKTKFKLLIFIFTAGLLYSCAPKKNDSHSVSLQFGSYSTAKSNILKFFIPEAKAAVTNLKFCFKRLRFKTASEVTSDDSSQDEDNIDFSLGELDISSGATALGTIQLPEGNYSRVEFDLENTCASGKSMQLTNASGSYSSTERITIKFEGSFSANADGTLTLGVQQILNQLNSYNGGGSLKTSAESISGVLTN